MDEETARTATTAIRALSLASRALQETFRRGFPLEGPLLDDIAALAAAVLFDLTLLPASASGGTAVTADHRPVIIRTPSSTGRIALAEEPRHLVVLAIQHGRIEVIFNGPSVLPLQHASKPRSRRGLWTISRKKLQGLDKGVNVRDRLPRVRTWHNLDEDFPGIAPSVLPDPQQVPASTTVSVGLISRSQFTRESGDEREARMLRNSTLGAELLPEPDPDGTKVHSVPTRRSR